MSWWRRQRRSAAAVTSPLPSTPAETADQRADEAALAALIAVNERLGETTDPALIDRVLAGRLAESTAAPDADRGLRRDFPDAGSSALGAAARMGAAAGTSASVLAEAVVDPARGSGGQTIRTVVSLEAGRPSDLHNLNLPFEDRGPDLKLPFEDWDPGSVAGVNAFLANAVGMQPGTPGDQVIWIGVHEIATPGNPLGMPLSDGRWTGGIIAALGDPAVVRYLGATLGEDEVLGYFSSSQRGTSVTVTVRWLREAQAALWEQGPGGRSPT